MLTLRNWADQTQCLTRMFDHAKARISVRSGHPKSSFVTKTLKSIGGSKRGAISFHFHAIFWDPTFGVGAPRSENSCIRH